MQFRFKEEVNIRLSKVTLAGELCIPLNASGLVIFSHGSGSSRFSPRNKMVADYLHEKNLATLLFDLLTRQEDANYENRFDIDLLTRRLVATTEWVQNFEPASQLTIGYFGASTGAASALRAASYLPAIAAVVSRGGRPDLAMNALQDVHAPTLLMVGSLDYDVLMLNNRAFMRLNCEKKLSVIDGATHLFEEKGTMEQVCAEAGAWFQKYLVPQKITIQTKNY